MDLHLVGGFLGSGKTTAIIGAVRLLLARGKKVGVVTNDQGRFLVDTAFFKATQVPTAEVACGCFCFCLTMSSGSILMWVVIVPVLVYYGVPIYVPAVDTFLLPTDFPMEDPEQPGVLLLGATSPSHASAIGIGFFCSYKITAYHRVYCFFGIFLSEF